MAIGAVMVGVAVVVGDVVVVAGRSEMIRTQKHDVEIDAAYARISPGVVYTFTRAVYKGILLRTGGWIMYNGLRYDVEAKHLGVGVYSVWLKVHDYGGGVG